MREYITHTEPIPYIIVKNYFPQREVDCMLEECDRLSPLLEYQAPKNLPDGHKQNTQMGVDEQYVNRKVSPILKSMDSIYNDTQLIEILEDSHWFWKSWFHTNSDGTFLSYAKHGDYYRGHKDIAVISLMYWLWYEPRPFVGGDILLTDYDINVPVERNQLLIIPSSISHEVTPITEGYGRWTAVRFLYLRSNYVTHQEAGGEIKPPKNNP